MVRLLVITCVVLLIVSLIGIIVAYGSPVKVEQEISLLDYRHEGTFDYSVYLKPSYLFGPPPGELSPNPKYPARIVDTIDFTFTYNPVATTPAEVHIDAVLEQPGIWQKAIELVPPINLDGDSVTSFSINVDEINGIFDIIRAETGLFTSTDNLIIKAYVGTSVEDLVYSLPLWLGNTVLEVGSNLRTTLPYGTGEFDYVVHLKPNSTFDTLTLTPPPLSSTTSTTILRSGDVILTNLVDSMDATYSYTFVPGGPVDQITSDVEITAVLENEFWSREFLLLSTEKAGGFVVNFPLDLAYYTDLLAAIRSETLVAAESTSLTITALVHTMAGAQ